MNKTAIILGATGLSGSLLLKKLVDDDSYGTIKLFLRKPTGNKSPKIQEFIGDMLQLEDFKKDFMADEVFCCIGTTTAKTKDKALYRAIDMGIPAAAAKLCAQNNIPVFMVISAIGANANSNIFYNRTKGEMEGAVLSQQIPTVYILRPSLIVGGRQENRVGESMAAWLMKILNPFLFGRLKKYRSIKANTIASAMHRLAITQLEVPTIIESDRIARIAVGD
ncbi:Uncharacterized conserved protein YbjT, contains NAD(P)-binding and DUF2867 domains [Saccharicrinis carchari]|uniref:Uncharacterized conserved protein YbjT, contains NAD(P)-binding and DUF2867 domains n=1 Tax=Saccharicrinis carchari TaxID=1168039 RepID=A0A521DIF4_SACCC|nr:NAD(P)H-binding protein [Saccharicrinis carchari]SMO71362.1 Uncharacterized conserved protein YbjT, contains NAD(P)-binding and DUF2867 domains [Saccharicrinis carchari]